MPKQPRSGPLVKVEISPLGILALSLWVEALERCPECGSLNTRGRAEDAWRRCLGCGAWFDPFDPENVQKRRQAVKDTFRGME